MNKVISQQIFTKVIEASPKFEYENNNFLLKTDDAIAFLEFKSWGERCILHTFCKKNHALSMYTTYSYLNLINFIRNRPLY